MSWMLVLQILVMILGTGIVLTWLIFYVFEERRDTISHQFGVEAGYQKRLKELNNDRS